PGPSGWPNAPAGYTTVSDRTFDVLSSILGSLSSGVQSLISVISDATAPGSPSGIMQLTYPVGFTGGTGPATIATGLGKARHFYSGVWWKVNSNWQGHNSNVNK